MIITCPECKSRYVVNPNALLPRGRTVRCAKCSHNWFEEKPKPEIEVLPPEDKTQTEETEKTKEAKETKKDKTKNSDDEHSSQDDLIDKYKSDDKESAPDEETSSGDDNFDFPNQKPTKRRRPIPKGSNLPALQRQKQDINKFGWISLVVFVTVIISMFLVMQGTIIQSWPPSKKLYIALGLDDSHKPAKAKEPEIIPMNERLTIRAINTALESVNDKVSLIITGNIENISKVDQEIPKLKVTLQDQNHATIREWLFDADKPMSTPGEIVTFRTTLPNSPSEAKNVSVVIISN